MQELETLIADIRAADLPLSRRHEAFAELIRRFQDMAYGYALAILGDPCQAEDVAQEAFLIVYQKIDQLREPAAFPGWLRRIVFSQCSRLTRGKRGPIQSLEALPDLPSPLLEPAVLIERREMQEQVLDAIRALPDQQRLAVVLCYIDGYSQKEVAGFLEVSVDALKKRLQRARLDLRARMVETVRDQLHDSRPSNDGRFVQAIQLALALEAVAAESQLALLEMLLVDGMNVDTPGTNGQTPLHWAARHGHQEAVELLLRNHADPGIRDSLGKTPCDWAAEMDCQAIAALLHQAEHDRKALQPNVTVPQHRESRKGIL